MNHILEAAWPAYVGSACKGGLHWRDGEPFWINTIGPVSHDLRNEAKYLRSSPSDSWGLQKAGAMAEEPRECAEGKASDRQRGSNSKAGQTSRHRRSYTCEKEGRKAGLVRNGSCCNASLEKVPASPAGPLAQSLSSKGLRQKWPGLVLPPGSTRVCEKSGQGMASLLRLGQTLEPPTPAGTQLALLSTAQSPMKGNLGIPPPWRIASLFPVLVAQMVKNLPAGDVGSIPGSGRSPGKRNGYPSQCSCLEYSMDRGAWWATIHGVTESHTQLSNTVFI